MPVKCPKCGTEAAEGHQFCRVCGAQLAGPQAPASTVAAPPVLPAGRIALLISALFLVLVCGALTGVAALRGLQPPATSPGGAPQVATATASFSAQTPDTRFTPIPPPTPTRDSSRGAATATPTQFSLPTETPPPTPKPTATLAPTATPVPTADPGG